MKILYLHQYFNTPEMNGSTRSYEMARRLVREGHEVDLITSVKDGIYEKKKTIEAGITVHWINIPYSNEMNFITRVWAFIKFAIMSSVKGLTIKSDIVFATSTPLTIAIPGLLIKWLKRIPMVFEIRDVWPGIPIEMGILKNPFLISLAELLEKLAYTQSEAIVALAPGMGDAAIRRGIDPSKVTIIQNGCDNSLFESIGNHDIDRLKTKNEWLSGKKIVLFAGALGKANGADFIVKIAEKTLQMDSNILFVAIGWGAEKGRIRNEASKVGVLNNNFYMLDPVSKKEIASWMRLSCFTLALFDGPKILWKDAVQNKFFDSMASGTPVASNFRGYQSIIAESNNFGIILDSDDFTENAQKLLDKINDKEWCEVARNNAISLSKSEFSRDILAERLNKLLLSINPEK